MRDRIRLLGLVLFMTASFGMWAQQRNAFRVQDEPLSAVLAALENRFQVYFAVDAGLIRDIRVSGDFSAMTLDGAVAYLERKTSLHFELVETNGKKSYTVRPHRTELPSALPAACLTGFIINEEGEPLSHAKVILRDKTGTYADSTGYFRLYCHLRPGDSILVSLYGYHERRLPAASFIRKVPTIVLKARTDAIGPVVITDGKGLLFNFDGRHGVITMSPGRAVQAAVADGDVMRTLQLLPGVAPGNEASAGLYVRGGTPDQNLILLDGITVYQPDHFFGAVSAFNPQSLQSVSFIRGGFGARYGGRVSSVLDMQGKPHNPRKRTATAGLNSLYLHAGLETPLKGRKSARRPAALYLGGRHSTGAWLPSPLYRALYAQAFQRGPVFRNRSGEFPSGMQVQPGMPSFGDLSLKLTLCPSDSDFLSFSLYGSYDAFSYLSRRSGAVSDEARDRLYIENRGWSLNWTRQWHSRFYSRLNAAGSDFWQTYDYTYAAAAGAQSVYREVDQVNALMDLSLRQENTWKPADSHEIEFGIQVSSIRAYDLRYQTEWSSVRKDTFRSEPSGLRGSARSYTGYLQYALVDWHGMYVAAGVRHTYYGLSNRFYAEPRFSAQYQLSPRLRFQAAWGRYVQFANRMLSVNALGVGEDVWALADGDSLPVLNAAHWIAGFSWKSGAYTLEAELYQKDLAGLLSYGPGYDPFNGEQQPGALYTYGSGVARGLDLLAQVQHGAFTAWAGYSLSRVQHQLAGLNAGQPFAAAHDQRHQLKLAASGRLGAWNLSGAWILTSGKPYSEPSGIGSVVPIDGEPIQYLIFGQLYTRRLPAYHRLDCSVNRSFALGGSRQLQTGVHLINVYNRRNIRDIRYTVGPDANGEPAAQQVVYLLPGFVPNAFLTFAF